MLVCVTVVNFCIRMNVSLISGILGPVAYNFCLNAVNCNFTENAPMPLVAHTFRFFSNFCPERSADVLSFLTGTASSPTR